MLLICANCDSKFRTSNSKRKFCSRLCAVTFRKDDQEYLNKLRKPKIRKEKKEIVCLYCGNMFSSSRDAKYCSTNCGNKDRLLDKGYLKPIPCKECGTVFKPIRSSRKFCSTQCSTANKKENLEFLQALSEGCIKRSSSKEYLQKLSAAASARWQTSEFREKMNDVFSSVEWAEKTQESYLTKDFVFPSGRKVRVQGYEDKAITELLKRYPEEDIVVEKTEIRKLIGILTYISEDGKEHRYIPDIYIKSDDTIIEVKSTWTYEIQKDINERKKNAVLAKGHAFEFMIL